VRTIQNNTYSAIVIITCQLMLAATFIKPWTLHYCH